MTRRGSCGNSEWFAGKCQAHRSLPVPASVPAPSALLAALPIPLTTCQPAPAHGRERIVFTRNEKRRWRWRRQRQMCKPAAMAKGVTCDCLKGAKCLQHSQTDLGTDALGVRRPQQIRIRRRESHRGRPRKQAVARYVRVHELGVDRLAKFAEADAPPWPAESRQPQRIIYKYLAPLLHTMEPSSALK